jgi:hypothetical protein
MFKPKKYNDGDMVNMELASSITVAKGDALAFTGGYLRLATATDTSIKYVAQEGAVVGAGEHPEILCVRTDKVLFEADTTGNMAVAYRGTVCDLTDEGELNENAVAVKVFRIESIVGATTDKKAQGYFSQDIFVPVEE